MFVKFDLCTGQLFCKRATVAWVCVFFQPLPIPKSASGVYLFAPTLYATYSDYTSNKQKHLARRTVAFVSSAA